MKFYDELQEVISWETMTGGEPEIPGLRLFADARQIPGRKDEQVVTLAEDRLSNVTFTLPPQYEPHRGDRLDGADVLEVSTVKDVSGTVLRWVAFAKK